SFSFMGWQTSGGVSGVGVARDNWNTENSEATSIRSWRRPVPPTFGRAGTFLGKSLSEAQRVRHRIGPDRIALSVNVNEPSDLCNLEQVELDKRFQSEGLPAYARLLLDILDGDPTLSIRDDEAEESWRIVEPILQV
ncbi:MAG: hypothetical protein HC801_14120, partial [Nitrospira sp.]|nr:hypothetical protein [Nitrospira sp.]